MHFSVTREHKNQEIQIPVNTGGGAQRIVVRAYHPTRAYTDYFRAAPVIKGIETFVIRIPKMPQEVNIDVYNERSGNQHYDRSFKVGKITSRAISLPFMSKINMDTRVSRFVNFNDEFCENAGLYELHNGICTIMSKGGEFRFDYIDVIRDSNGKELKTPARSNDNSKIIEIARKYYLLYSVPERKAINLHEFGHIFKNKNPDDEFEADKNGITIYLGHGNPIVSAYDVFLKVFDNTPSDMNKRRYDVLNGYIMNWSKIMTKRMGIKTMVTQSLTYSHT